ncbi:MAG TPA: hypothetical protein VM406_14105 [Noviherbaspirillum sp.]|nr:hypothetical protein [Noviherbaspirillum sp.]
MKPAVVAASVLFLSFSAAPVAKADARHVISQPKKLDAMVKDKRRPVIHVKRGGWGGAREEDIEHLLAAIATDLLQHFPGRELGPISVSPSVHGPVVLYQKGPRNEYQILLSARGENWAEYVYEFSHELLHVLANYEHHAHDTRHLWFEEMLGEAVSLHMLKRFSNAWRESPPLPQHVSYAGDLSRFTQRALFAESRRLPRGVTFEQWFRVNGPILSANPHAREKNDLVAGLFLPLLEHMPDWTAFAHLNAGQQQAAPSFHEHLLRWYWNTPAEHRQMVVEAMHLFHFTPPDDLAGNAIPAAASAPAAPARPLGSEPHLHRHVQQGPQARH